MSRAHTTVMSVAPMMRFFTGQTSQSGVSCGAASQCFTRPAGEKKSERPKANLLHSRWRLCCLTDMVCPLRVLRRRTQLPAPPPAGGHPRRARVRGYRGRPGRRGGRVFRGDAIPLEAVRPFYIPRPGL